MENGWLELKFSHMEMTLTHLQIIQEWLGSESSVKNHAKSLYKETRLMHNSTIVHLSMLYQFMNIQQEHGEQCKALQIKSQVQPKSEYLDLLNLRAMLLTIVKVLHVLNSLSLKFAVKKFQHLEGPIPMNELVYLI